MKLRLISKISLEKTSNFKDSKNTNNILNYSKKRRKFIKFTGTTIIGISIYGLSKMLFPNKAYSNDPFDDPFFDDPFFDNPFDDPFFDDPFFNELFPRDSLLDTETKRPSLTSDRWQVREPMSGSVTIINQGDADESGDMGFVLVDQKKLDDVEDSKTAYFEAPAGTKSRYEFYDGTRGKYPGKKKLGIFTRKNKSSVDATVYV